MLQQQGTVSQYMAGAGGAWSGRGRGRGRGERQRDERARGDGGAGGRYGSRADGSMVRVRLAQLMGDAF